MALVVEGVDANTPAPVPPKLTYLRMWQYAVITILLMAYVIYIRPDQLAIIAKHVGQGTLAAWATYFTDRALFRNFVPTFSEIDPRDIVTAFCVMRRPVIFLAWCIVLSSLG